MKTPTGLAIGNRKAVMQTQKYRRASRAHKHDTTRRR